MVILGMWMNAYMFQPPASQMQLGAMHESHSPEILQGFTS